MLKFSVRVRVVGYDLGSGLLLRLDVLVKTVRCRRRLGFRVKLELGFGRGRCRDGTFRRGRHMGEDIPWWGQTSNIYSPDKFSSRLCDDAVGYDNFILRLEAA